MVEDRFTVEVDLPEQDLGLIQHTCEVLTDDHTEGHHQCCRWIHGELARLTSPEWKFMCTSGEKYLQTIWDELPLQIEDLQYLSITKDTIWNTTRNREMECTLTREE